MVWQFILFWWHCVRIGWEFGDGLFSIIERVVLVVLLILFVLKKIKQKERKAWEDSLMRFVLYVFLFLFVVSTCSVAPFRQYREADEARGSVKHHAELLSRRLLEYAKIWPSSSNPLFVLQKINFAEKFDDNFGPDIRRTQINLDESNASSDGLREICVWPDFKQIDSNGIIWMALEFSNCAAKIPNHNL